MKRSGALLGLAAMAAAWAGPAAAETFSSYPVAGMGPRSGVDVYIENPDAQPPIYWSQGTEPPPPQPPRDYGGGLLQYMLTGTELRPVPRYYRRAPAGYRYVPAQGLAYPPGPVAYAAPGAAVVSYDAAGEPVQAAIDPMYRRQEVAYRGPQGPGTIVIDTGRKFLYLVQAGGRALRYGIGVGRPGFLWAGTKTITRKAEWPDWTPPSEMVARRPDLPRHMAGGIANPLGARAMYLGSSLYRIHGTNEPNTIGTNVSSGCIRLLNEDVADLYGRVKVGTKVFVM
jgi:hypothetical protein